MLHSHHCHAAGDEREFDSIHQEEDRLVVEGRNLQEAEARRDSYRDNSPEEEEAAVHVNNSHRDRGDRDGRSVRHLVS